MMLTEEEIIEIKKRTKNPDPTKKWGDSIAFAQEIIKEIESRLQIHIECETEYNGIKGSTSLNVIRIEKNDDDSFTVVSDHWPSRK